MINFKFSLMFSGLYTKFCNNKYSYKYATFYNKKLNKRILTLNLNNQFLSKVPLGYSDLLAFSSQGRLASISVIGDRYYLPCPMTPPVCRKIQIDPSPRLLNYPCGSVGLSRPSQPSRGNIYNKTPRQSHQLPARRKGRTLITLPPPPGALTRGGRLIYIYGRGGFSSYGGGLLSYGGLPSSGCLFINAPMRFSCSRGVRGVTCMKLSPCRYPPLRRGNLLYISLWKMAAPPVAGARGASSAYNPPPASSTRGGCLHLGGAYIGVYIRLLYPPRGHIYI
jgi:hypothetical protein